MEVITPQRRGQGIDTSSLWDVEGYLKGGGGFGSHLVLWIYCSILTVCS